MLSIGFCFALVPVANKLFKDRQKRIEFYNRHLNFFNAHPYFSSFALGAISRVEEVH
jgi:mannose/fructose/N-acetylgalactosamine-specific phosphotransferase system component IID